MVSSGLDLLRIQYILACNCSTECQTGVNSPDRYKSCQTQWQLAVNEGVIVLQDPVEAQRLSCEASIDEWGNVLLRHGMTQ
ncbi:hypothetical protein J1614_005936 [Plenodomus biglobosus]|nr:hypothetical protein J1614_005936 [Plenodomus biglobosus]